MSGRVMVDIETASVSNAMACVLSVGLVEFNFFKSGPVFGDSRAWVLDPREQFALGRGTAKPTLDWWRAQPEAARAQWLRGETTPLTTALRNITAYINQTTEVWANGIVFDIGNLAMLYEQTDIALPWKYNNVLDARTIYRLTPHLRSRPADLDNGLAHSPVADCYNQVWGLWEHWPEEGLAPDPLAESDGASYRTPGEDGLSPAAWDALDALTQLERRAAPVANGPLVGRGPDEEDAPDNEEGA